MSQIVCLKDFPFEFLSNIVDILKKEIFYSDEFVFKEGTQEQKLFFILEGRVSAVKVKDHSYLKTLEKDSTFGEISFFL